jgi:lactate permease
MANGTIVGAHLAGLPPAELGVASAIVSIPLLFAWLLVFWRLAAAAELAGSNAIRAQEAAWLLLALGSLVCANRFLGPEIAGMAALGPLIVLRFWRDERPDGKAWRSAFRVGLPYAILIVSLAASRAIPALTAALAAPLTLQLFADGPAWVPLLHPGTWLFGVGLLTAVVSGRSRTIRAAVGDARAHGRKAVLTIAIYLVVAQIMADSGMAQDIADGVRGALGPLAVVMTPLLAGALGFLTGSSNATNGLLMRSQVSLADDLVAPLWIAALQNTASAAMTMLSPVRVAMGCALVGHSDLQREVYTRAWPLGVAALGVLTFVAPHPLRPGIDRDPARRRQALRQPAGLPRDVAGRRDRRRLAADRPDLGQGVHFAVDLGSRVRQDALRQPGPGRRPARRQRLCPDLDAARLSLRLRPSRRQRREGFFAFREEAHPPTQP